ncbi:MAG: hypothetical protein F4Y67_10260 [Chloroflexi bacterium]|nr:hypothetical protein [Chloroflexota bacterium]
MPQKMEVILTLSNRISFAGAIPLFVALGLLALVAVIAFAPARPVSATANTSTCDLSAVHLDMLLDRYGMKSYACNTIDFATGEATDGSGLRTTGDDQPTLDVWDYSGHGLNEFAISKDDAQILKRLKSTAAAGSTLEVIDADITTNNLDVAPDAVKYIDLSGNPLTIDDVDFTNIPPRVAVILSADSNINGFQTDEYTVTEASAGYVAVAFPNLKFDPATSTTLAPTITISGSDADKEFGTTDQPFQSLSHRQLIKLGVAAAANDAARTTEINSLSEDKIFYLPLVVNKDNDNRDDWEFRLTISSVARAEAGFELANKEADITVLDADAPATSVCDRTEDVEAAIVKAVTPSSTNTITPAERYGGHTRCDDLTLRDLGAITDLPVIDDDGDGEPIEDLVAGDFEGLKGLTSLTLTGAGSLPSGIFAEVGKDGAGVQISFAKNDNKGDEDIAVVGKYTPSTIPQHIFDDQEPKQVIILDDDLNDKKKGVTSGLDATAYTVDEGSQFFVLTPAMQTYYFLGKSVVIEGTDPPSSTIYTPTITDRGSEDNPKVARYAVPNTNKFLDDDNDKDESMVLFLFRATDSSDLSASDPTSATDLVDLATVTVIDDD